MLLGPRHVYYGVLWADSKGAGERWSGVRYKGRQRVSAGGRRPVERWVHTWTHLGSHGARKKLPWTTVEGQTDCGLAVGKNWICRKAQWIDACVRLAHGAWAPLGRGWYGSTHTPSTGNTRLPKRWRLKQSVTVYKVLQLHSTFLSNLKGKYCLYTLKTNNNKTSTANEPEELTYITGTACVYSLSSKKINISHLYRACVRQYNRSGISNLKKKTTSIRYLQ